MNRERQIDDAIKKLANKIDQIAIDDAKYLADLEFFKPTLTLDDVLKLRKHGRFVLFTRRKSTQNIVSAVHEHSGSVAASNPNYIDLEEFACKLAEEL